MWLVVLLLVGFVSICTANEYTLIDLGDIVPNGVSHIGEVAGSRELPPTRGYPWKRFQPVVLRSLHDMIEIGILPGDETGSAVDIKGQWVIGGSANAALFGRAGHAFVWTPGQKNVQALEPFSKEKLTGTFSTSTSAVGVNGAGTVVGHQDTDFTRFPVVWIQGKPLKLADAGVAEGINEHGDIVGARAIQGFDHGAGHSLLLLYDAKTSHGENINYFNSLGYDPSIASTSLF